MYWHSLYKFQVLHFNGYVVVCWPVILFFLSPWILYWCYNKKYMCVVVKRWEKISKICKKNKDLFEFESLFNVHGMFLKNRLCTLFHYPDILLYTKNFSINNWGLLSPSLSNVYVSPYLHYPTDDWVVTRLNLSVLWWLICDWWLNWFWTLY